MDCLAIVSLIQEFVVALSVQNFLCALTGNFICSESMNTMHTHSITYTWMRHIKMNNGGGLTFVKARVAICRKLIMLRMHSFHPTESRFVSYIVPLLLALINLKSTHPSYFTLHTWVLSATNLFKVKGMLFSFLVAGEQKLFLLHLIQLVDWNRSDPGNEPYSSPRARKCKM